MKLKVNENISNNIVCDDGILYLGGKLKKKDASKFTKAARRTHTWSSSSIEWYYIDNIDKVLDKSQPHQPIPELTPVNGQHILYDLFAIYPEFFMKSMEKGVIIPQLTYGIPGVWIEVNFGDVQRYSSMWSYEFIADASDSLCESLVEHLDDCLYTKMYDYNIFDSAITMSKADNCPWDDVTIEYLRTNIVRVFRMTFLGFYQNIMGGSLSNDGHKYGIIRLMYSLGYPVADYHVTPAASVSARKWINKISKECKICTFAGDRAEYYTPGPLGLSLDNDMMLVLDHDNLSVENYNEAVAILANSGYEMYGVRPTKKKMNTERKRRDKNESDKGGR